MNEVMIVSYVVSFLLVLNYHVATDCCYQRDHSLSNYFLNVLPRYEGSKQLNQLLSHTFHTIGFIFIVTLVASLIILFFLIISLKVLEALIVAQNLCKDGKMEIE